MVSSSHPRCRARRPRQGQRSPRRRLLPPMRGSPAGPGQRSRLFPWSSQTRGWHPVPGPLRRRSLTLPRLRGSQRELASPRQPSPSSPLMRGSRPGPGRHSSRRSARRAAPRLTPGSRPEPGRLQPTVNTSGSRASGRHGHRSGPSRSSSLRPGWPAGTSQHQGLQSPRPQGSRRAPGPPWAQPRRHRHRRPRRRDRRRAAADCQYLRQHDRECRACDSLRGGAAASAVDLVAASLAAGTGTAHAPVPAIAASPALASASGPAPMPVISVTVFAGLATATGTAQQPVAGSSSRRTQDWPPPVAQHSSRVSRSRS